MRPASIGGKPRALHCSVREPSAGALYYGAEALDLLSKLKRRASRLRYSVLRWQYVAEVRLGLRSSDGMYGTDYFGGASKDAASPDSGYASYDRASSHANVAALLLWKHLSPRRSLDVGCALGFVVQALRELKVEAYGVDFSHFRRAPGPAQHPLFRVPRRLERGPPSS